MAVLDEFVNALANGKVLAWLEKYVPKVNMAENSASTVLYRTYMQAAKLAQRLHEEEEKKKAPCVYKVEWKFDTAGGNVCKPYLNLRYEDFGDTVAFQIIEQFGIKCGFRNTFNGIEFRSESHPEWSPCDKTLFVRGAGASMDQHVLLCTKEEWSQIARAVDEFNKFYGPAF